VLPRPPNSLNAIPSEYSHCSGISNPVESLPPGLHREQQSAKVKYHLVLLAIALTILTYPKQTNMNWLNFSTSLASPSDIIGACGYVQKHATPIESAESSSGCYQSWR